jgi:transmembrane sensor
MTVPPSSPGEAEGRSPNDAAAFWDSRLRSPLCTEADRAAFEDWRGRDPEHEAAFDRLQLGLRALHEAYTYDPELRAMRAEAAAHRPARRRLGIAAAVAAVILAGVGGGAWWWRGAQPSAPQPVLTASAPSLYQTGVGERTTVILSDGSKVTLNTRSRLEVNYAPGRRDVTLAAGQAFFEVAKDAARPFVVRAGSRQVTALGTAFDVRLDARQVQVTLVEGRVTVAPIMAPVWNALVPAERTLVPGEKLVAANNSYKADTSNANLSAETSWRQGRVVFEDTPLVAAVAEMNRYTPSPILIGDPSLDDIRVNGMFLTTQPMSFVGAITTYFPVDARSTAAGATVLTPRG